MVEDVQEVQEKDPQTLFAEIFSQDSYQERLNQMVIDGKTAFFVKFQDVYRHNTELGLKLVKKPDEYLKYAGDAAIQRLIVEEREYAEKIEAVKVRVCNLFQNTLMREVGSEHIGTLIMVSGIVMRAAAKRPKIAKACFQCRRCGTRNIIEQTDYSSNFLKKPTECQSPDCGVKSVFDFVEEECTFVDEQEIWLQETAEDMPPGEMPVAMHLKLGKDLVNLARPGDMVSVVGIARSLQKKVKGGTLNTVDVFIDVNSVTVLGKESEVLATTTEEQTQIYALAADPFVHSKIIASIAPAIHGFDHIKEAIMYQLFGGVPKEAEGIRIRGEVNTLLIGDPGTAKSQLLKYVSKLAFRGIYCSGKGTSGVGLTATVTKDAETNQYMLQAGALVLADRGMACIDELDKMDKGDRENIHESLEQQTVSIAKGGIVATLNTRTAVLAAANPVLGRYNSYVSIIENISLPVTLLSRFDLIFLMLDVPEEKKDRELSGHILGIHAGTGKISPVIPPKLLRKYISFARQIKPVLTQEAMDKIQEFYLHMRKASETVGTPLALGARQLEAITRISEAHAKAAMHEKVSIEDAVAAINIMMESLQEVGLDVSSGKVDIDILMTGKPKSTRDRLGAILAVISKLSKEQGMCPTDDLVNVLEKDYGISVSISNEYIGKLLHDGTLFEPREGHVQKT